MESFYAEFPLDALPSDPHQHGSVEFIYVLGGSLTVDVVGEQTTLNVGDAMYFDSSVPHSYRRDGKEICTALVVTAH